MNHPMIVNRNIAKVKRDSLKTKRNNKDNKIAIRYKRKSKSYFNYKKEGYDLFYILDQSIVEINSIWGTS